MEQLPFTPLIIIGAGRSGTNILRDTLCRLDDFATWDCDEINPVWRHGNIAAEHDEFEASMATPKVTKFIRQTFQRQWKKQGQPKFLVEKTCANSLRVPFINAIFPEAKLLFIVRDGVDVVASAQKRWRGEMELASWPYYRAKIVNTPLSDLPIYGWRFLKARAEMLTGKKEHLSFWGPQFAELNKLPKDTSLDELCARQWAACVGKAAAGFADVSHERVHALKYESLTSDPASTISATLEFLHHAETPSDIKSACDPISGQSVGKGRGQLKLTKEVWAILEPALKEFDYALPSAHASSETNDAPKTGELKYQKGVQND